MPLCQKCDAKAQTSYERGAYGKMHAALEARIKHKHLGECFCDTKKQKAGLLLALSYVLFILLVPFCTVPGFTNTQYVQHCSNGVQKIKSSHPTSDPIKQERGCIGEFSMVVLNTPKRHTSAWDSPTFIVIKQISCPKWLTR